MKGIYYCMKDKVCNDYVKYYIFKEILCVTNISLEYNIIKYIIKHIS